MKITRREAVAVSGLALAGAAHASGSALALMEHEGHGMSRRAAAKPQRRDDTKTMAQWIDIAKGTQHPARTIEPSHLTQFEERSGRRREMAILRDSITQQNQNGLFAPTKKCVNRSGVRDLTAPSACAIRFSKHKAWKLAIWIYARLTRQESDSKMLLRSARCTADRVEFATEPIQSE